jgi:hypothetical protein
MTHTGKFLNGNTLVWSTGKRGKFLVRKAELIGRSSGENFVW